MRTMMRQYKVQHRTEFSAWSDSVCEQVRRLPQWQSASPALLFHALPDEPSLQALMDEAMNGGRQVLLPVVVDDDLELRAYHGVDSLSTGSFGIQEPVGDAFPVSKYNTIELVLIPGMAFDTVGHRLGRGCGYYDRLLPRLPHALRVGICFPFQLVPEVPFENHDIPVQMVLTGETMQMINPKSL